MSGNRRQPGWPGADLPGRRIFVAAPLSAEAGAAVADLVDRVRAQGVPGGGHDVRWVRLDGLHLTLRFLGPTLEPQVDAAADAVRLAASGAWPFDLRIEGAGTFPPAGRPRALWLGIVDPGRQLAALAASVDRRLVDAGWPAETRPFRAHLTLARSDGVAAAAAVGRRLRELASGLTIPIRIDRIGLFESLTGGGPARYIPIETAALSGSRD